MTLIATEQYRTSELKNLAHVSDTALNFTSLNSLQESECNLNPVSGASQIHPDTDPVSGNVIPLICSNFDAHKINSASASKF